MQIVDLIEAVKRQPTPPGFRYNAKSNRYINSRGQYVPFKTIYTLLDDGEDESTRQLLRLATALQNKELQEPEWFLASMQIIQRQHVQSAALGAGGFDSLRPADFMRIDRKLREDAPRLVRFGQDIVSGRNTGGQIENRITMYIGNARTHFWSAQPRPLTKRDETVVERRELDPPAEHCEFCVILDELSWQPYGTLPYPGESDPEFEGDQCLTKCRCRMSRKVIKKKELAQYVTKAGWKKRAAAAT